MEFKSSFRYAKTSPRKAGYVLALVRGKSVNDALGILRVINKRSSHMIDKTIRAAVASADEIADVNIDSLYVSVATADGGPSRKGHRPRSRGMANRILRRTSHITIILSDRKDKR